MFLNLFRINYMKRWGWRACPQRPILLKHSDKFDSSGCILSQIKTFNSKRRLWSLFNESIFLSQKIIEALIHILSHTYCFFRIGKNYWFIRASFNNIQLKLFWLIANAPHTQVYNDLYNSIKVAYQKHQIFFDNFFIYRLQPLNL